MSPHNSESAIRKIARLMELARNTWAYCRAKGISKAWDHTSHRLSEPFFERWYGVSTGGYVDKEDIGVSEVESIRYEPADYICIRRALKLLKPGNNDVLLDYGSGKGRVLVMAGTFPLRRIIGVEISDKLNIIAAENLKRAHNHLQCCEFELVTMNAVCYSIPSDVTIVFLYNPFTGRTLQQVFQNIRNSIQAAPRQFRIVYKNPKIDLAKLDWLVKQQTWVCDQGHEVCIFAATIQSIPTGL